MLCLSRFVALVGCMTVLGSCGGGGGGGSSAPLPWYVAGPLTVGLPVLGSDLQLGFVDGDAHPDVILAGQMTALGAVRDTALEAALGVGDGSFVGAAPVPGVVTDGSESSLGMRVGYFDLDGQLDAVVFADLPGETGAVVCRGDGDGGFDPLAPLPTGFGRYLEHVAVVDANEDFLDDLAFATSDAKLGFLLADGLGGFVPGGLVPLPVFGPIQGIAVADADRDGHLDILAVQGSSLETARGDGLGGASLGSGMPISIGAMNQGVAVDNARRPGWLAISGLVPVAHVTFYRHTGSSGFDPDTATRVDLGPGYDVLGDMAFAVGPDLELPRLAILAWSTPESAIRMFVARTEDLTVPADPVVVAMRGPLQVEALDLNGDVIEDLVVSGFDVDESVTPPRQRILVQTLFGTGP